MRYGRTGKILLVPFLLSITVTQSSETQGLDIVLDPSNLAQAVIQVAHLVESNINEAAMIANQIQQLENDIRNLESLPFDIIRQFRSRLHALFSTLGSIDGLMQHLADLDRKFSEVYPDFSTAGFPVPGEAVADDMYQRVERTRDMIRGSLKTSAQVLDALPSTQEELSELMRNSQGAIGILQATQAGSQIAGSIASQLINLNAQLASYIQAHTAQMMEQNGVQTAVKNRMDHILDDWAVPYIPDPVEENPF